MTLTPKVIFIANTLDQRDGGIARSVPLLADAVAEAGGPAGEVHLIFPDYGNPMTTGLLPSSSTLHLHPVDCRGPGARQRHWRNGRRVSALLEKLVIEAGENPCILHHAGVWTGINHAVAAFAGRKNVRLVCSPRGMLDPWSLNYARIKKRFVWWLFAHRDLQKVSMFHATSEMEADYIRRLGFTQPIAIVPNGVQLPPVGEREGGKMEMERRGQETADREAVRNWGESKKEREGEDVRNLSVRTALFLSRINPKKGLPRLIEAWGAVRPEGWRLWIAGPDESGYANAISRQIEQAGLAGTISLLGNVDDEDKWNLYRSADLFVLPTETENFGIVVAEALACEVPVLTTKGAPWEALAREACGWWVENTTAGITEGLRAALAVSDEERRAMGRRGRTYVENHLQWPAVGKEMYRGYEAVQASIA